MTQKPSAALWKDFDAIFDRMLGLPNLFDNAELRVMEQVQELLFAPSEIAPSAWSPISKSGLLRGIRHGKPTEQDLLIAEADGDTIRYFYDCAPSHVAPNAKLKRLREAWEGMVAALYPFTHRAEWNTVMVELDGAINDFLIIVERTPAEIGKAIADKLAGDAHSMTGVCPTCGSDANETTPSTTPRNGVYLRPEVRVFAEAMELKLRENEHKKPWRECETGYLIDCLHKEVRELVDCFPGEQGRMLDEAADVGNFAMFLATRKIDEVIAVTGVETTASAIEPNCSLCGQKRYGAPCSTFGCPVAVNARADGGAKT